MQLAGYHEVVDQDSNAYYVQKAIAIAHKLNYRRGGLLARISEFFVNILRANYPKALDIAQKNLQLAESLPYDRERDMVHVHNNLSLVKRLMNDSLGAIRENMIADSISVAWGRKDGDMWGITGFRSQIKEKQQQKDSAIYYELQAYNTVKTAPFRKIYSPLATAALADLYKRYGMFTEARARYDEALTQCNYFDNVYIEARIYMNLAGYSILTSHEDSALYFGRKALDISNLHKFGDYASTVNTTIAGIYEKQGKADSALKYFKLMQAAKDSIFGSAKMQKFQLLISQNKAAQSEAVASKERLQEKVRLYSSLAAVIFFIIISTILYLNNRQKQRAYSIIRKQKQETDVQKSKVEQAYQELKATQTQLVHAEKMASLGELTAGIAHEIQNPLNFVNNFSEINAELLEEMQQELHVGHIDKADELATAIRENEMKISQHGKRADGIVKGMLQHARSSTGQKEPTDLNALADECLRLAFHGFRARDQSFAIATQLHADPDLGLVNILPQDIGRVLLNLLNNAFYAVVDKKKKSSNGYEPRIEVSTARQEGMAVIRIRDNGGGIPRQHLEKIFQPFFTTKPTGQGTGLGLSLSYDIIKAQGGEIGVDTREGEFTEFTIRLPL